VQSDFRKHSIHVSPIFRQSIGGLLQAVTRAIIAAVAGCEVSLKRRAFVLRSVLLLAFPAPLFFP
jgi:hypothetical protein